MSRLRIPRRRGEISGKRKSQALDVRGIDLVQRAIPLLHPIRVVTDPLLPVFPGRCESRIVHLTWLLSHCYDYGRQDQDSREKQSP